MQSVDIKYHKSIESNYYYSMDYLVYCNYRIKYYKA